ncbi:hypothetical protein RHMOL_Rhmol07G0030900 [Rhododendron molle]|uniref:Uncharacterized protein n=1 Tax=Rhododendron molle TaxID=49168 RepID=A0ACC0MXG4_RHOML|nr:hypothetical protein RHMOL_Rhmol07G0030900 [Rhododendron molle]
MGGLKSSVQDCDPFSYLPPLFVEAEYQLPEELKDEDSIVHDDGDFLPRLVLVEYKKEEPLLLVYSDDDDGDGFHGYDGYEEDSDDSGGDNDGVDSEDEGVEDIERIEEFIAKQKGYWREELFNDKLLCMTAGLRVTSTLGSLEALLEFLKSPAVKIPVSCISIGPVHKKDVMKASVMLEKKKEFATILAFDVKVTPEARELADEGGVKIFIVDIIYHLFDQFKAYIDNLKEENKKEAAEEAVFLCVLRIMPNCVFNKKDPIVLGVDVVEGIAKLLSHCY